jgi:uracil-DNA glycosylase family 4
MSESARVLGPGCGPLDVDVVFVGEAPGRLGADGSHLPFHGDKSGHNFESLIGQVGISRYQVFVTNAVLCNPKDEAGNNATPTATEISNCAPFLKEQIEILHPTIVVTLGAVALKSCDLVSPHSLTLKTAVRTSNAWFGKSLIPAYHPGQRAMVHRSFANQLADYQFIAESARRIGRSKNRSRGSATGRSTSGSKLANVTRRILEQQPEGLSYFALHKLYFLAEVAYMEAAGERLTNAYVVRQKDGPYCVDLHLAKLPAMIPGLAVDWHGAVARIRLRPQRSFDDTKVESGLLATEIQTIDQTVRRYGSLPDAELKRVAYLSAPMRALLRREKNRHVNMFNVAVLPYQGKNS